MADLSLNATIGYCVVCGTWDKRQLCRLCRELYTDEATGQLHPAVRELQKLQDKDSKRETRNRDAYHQGKQATPSPKGGRPPLPGVAFVPLEVVPPLRLHRALIKTREMPQ